MALQGIVGVLIKKEIKEKKLKFDSRNLIVNKVRYVSNHQVSSINSIKGHFQISTSNRNFAIFHQYFTRLSEFLSCI